MAARNSSSPRPSGRSPIGRPTITSEENGLHEGQSLRHRRLVALTIEFVENYLDSFLRLSNGCNCSGNKGIFWYDSQCSRPSKQINEKSAPIVLDLRGHQVLASRRIPGHLVVSPKSRSLSGRLPCIRKFSPCQVNRLRNIQAANGKVILAMAIRASISGASWTRPVPSRPTARNQMRPIKIRMSKMTSINPRPPLG